MFRISTVAIFLLQFIAINVFAGGDFTLSGTITNPLSNEVIISYVDYRDGNWLDYRQYQVKDNLDKNGKFSSSFSVPEGYTLLTIQNGDEATEIYAHPGYKINMTVDAVKFDETVKYTGEGSNVANFMAEHMRQSSFSHNIYRELQQLAIKEPEEYLTAVNERVQTELDFLINNGGNMPQSFIQFWDKNHEYLRYSSMLSYPQMHEIVKKQSYDIGEIPKENYVVIENVPVKFDDKYIAMQNYRSYISTYYYTLLTKEGISNTADAPNKVGEKMIELSRNNMPVKSQQYVYATNLRDGMKSLPYTDIAARYAAYDKLYGANPYKSYLEKLLATKKKTSKGSPAIDMVFKNERGEDVKLSELKGKVVYLDFWASWCGPCKAQFPYTGELKEYFKGRDVVFAYVSLDENKESWETAKEKFHLTGLHNLADGAWNAKEAKEYGVQGIPAYFLIDKQGNFATDDTPRPSQKDELIALIEALL